MLTTISLGIIFILICTPWSPQCVLYRATQVCSETCVSDSTTLIFNQSWAKNSPILIKLILTLPQFCTISINYVGKHRPRGSLY
ncbi:hypothetical protein BDR07DRAFT_330286 [Suillus spraguei]|nr:hypothetical protein BDR07DRAFT_330286 [Suillus spraguei]